MSTVQEIYEAVAKLPELQRFELMHLLHSQYEGDNLECDELLAEAAEGAKQIEAGLGISLKEARRLTRTWIRSSPFAEDARQLGGDYSLHRQG